jgi:hypothetical protein
MFSPPPKKKKQLQAKIILNTHRACVYKIFAQDAIVSCLGFSNMSAFCYLALGLFRVQNTKTPHSEMVPAWF